MSRVFDFTHAIVRPPASSAVHGLRARGGPDPDFADLLAEHAGYVAALAAAGISIAHLAPLDSFPDALFVEDPALVFPGLAVLLNPGAPSRAGEVETLRSVLEERFDRVVQISEGHADGGDVLVMPGRAFIGLSARTDQAGAENLAALLEASGLATTIVTPPPGVLHLKTACSLIDEETVFALPQMASSPAFAGLRVVAVPEGETKAANKLRIRDAALIGDTFPKSREIIESFGIRTIGLKVEQIGRIDAGLSCMSLRWHKVV